MVNRSVVEAASANRQVGREDPRYTIVWPKPKWSVEGWILSRQVQQFNTHYIDVHGKGRTVPCIGRENGCQICGPFASLRWKGFLAIFNPSCTKPVISELTPYAFDHCRELNDLSYDLRGRWLKVTRLGNRPNGPVKATVSVRSDVPELPDEPDIRFTLMHVWGSLPTPMHRQTTPDGKGRGAVS